MANTRAWYVIKSPIRSITTTKDLLLGTTETEIHYYSLSEIVSGKKSKNKILKVQEIK